MTSDLWPLTSDVWLWLWPLTSDLRPPTSDLWPPTSDLRPPTTNLWPPTGNPSLSLTCIIHCRNWCFVNRTYKNTMFFAGLGKNVASGCRGEQCYAKNEQKQQLFSWNVGFWRSKRQKYQFLSGFVHVKTPQFYRCLWTCSTHRKSSVILHKSHKKNKKTLNITVFTMNYARH